MKKVTKITKWKVNKTPKCHNCNKKCNPKYMEMPDFYEYLRLEKNLGLDRGFHFNIKLWEKLTKFYCSDECLMTEKI